MIQEAVFTKSKQIAERIRQPLIKNIDALKDQLKGIAMAITASHGLLGDDFEAIVNTAKFVIETELDKFFRTDQSEFRRRMQLRFNECFNTAL